MPTTRPRYTVTDTGPLRGLLDDAQRRWPEIESRKELLLRLAQTGHHSLNLDELEEEAGRRWDRQRAALAGLQRTVGRRGRHRLPIPDLLIAACAQQHQAAVLHHDRHYDTLAEVLAFEPVRLPG
ncbi:MAG TPA: hypothetical protein VK655_00890 [Solirubrobacteraceae bacterium]|nr:hypothetical protein [Solirubrobacteraceae bacterium]